MPPLIRYEFASDLNPSVIIKIVAYNEDDARDRLDKIHKTITDFELLNNH